MLVKSICLITLLCLMEMFSISCESIQLVYPRPAETGFKSSEVEETEIARVDLYPSPLQFAN